MALTLPAAVTASPADEAASAPAKPDAAKGQTVAQVCSACHASDGSRGSPAYPILQGQHPEYIVKQLADFKNGTRKNPIMSGMAAALTEDDMRNVAAFYTAKVPKPGFAKDRDLAELGERIYRGGLFEKALPACAGCHGPAGAGIPSQFPRLSGQHADYTVAQLTAFRGGGRANAPQMVAIAAKMSDREMKAVSEYVAGLR